MNILSSFKCVIGAETQSDLEKRKCWLLEQKWNPAANFWTMCRQVVERMHGPDSSTTVTQLCCSGNMDQFELFIGRGVESNRIQYKCKLDLFLEGTTIFP